MEENRKKALAAALGQIEKQFGKGSVMRLGDAPASWDVEAAVAILRVYCSCPGASATMKRRRAVAKWR